MQITLLNETFEWDMKNKSLDELFNEIDRKVTNTPYTVSHLLIDGVEVFDDFYTYIEERMDDIEQIEVGVRTFAEFINDLLSSMHQYLERATPELEKLSELFYQRDETSWEQLQLLIEAVQWIHEAIRTIDSKQQKLPEWNQIIVIAVEMQEQFEPLEEAMVAQDTVLLGDLLQYEWLPIFIKLKTALETVFAQKGEEEDVD